MKKAERDLIMRQQVTLPQTPEERRQLAGLDEDLRSVSLTGKPLALRLRNFVSTAEGYLASAGGPLPYMLRLREIERQTAAHETALAGAWHTLAADSQDEGSDFGAAWTSAAQAWRFDELNDLIERHNHWYPVESRLPMDPRTGDFVPVNGRDYRLQSLGVEWVLERFPALRDRALAA